MSAYVPGSAASIESRSAALSGTSTTSPPGQAGSTRRTAGTATSAWRAIAVRLVGGPGDQHQGVAPSGAPPARTSATAASGGLHRRSWSAWHPAPDPSNPTSTSSRTGSRSNPRNRHVMSTAAGPGAVGRDGAGLVDVAQREVGDVQRLRVGDHRAHQVGGRWRHRPAPRPRRRRGPPPPAPGRAARSPPRPARPSDGRRRRRARRRSRPAGSRGSTATTTTTSATTAAGSTQGRREGAVTPPSSRPAG